MLMLPVRLAAEQPSYTSSSRQSFPPVKLSRVALSGSRVDFEDRSRPPTKRFAIAPLDLTVRNGSLDLSKPLPVSLDATVNGQSRLRLEGSLTPEPLATELDVALQGARLQILQPLVQAPSHLPVTGGIGVDGIGAQRGVAQHV